MKPLILLSLAAFLAPQQNLTINARGQARRLSPPAQNLRGSIAETGEENQARNVIVILADDFGVDMVNSYGEGANPPCTPNIDGLAENGILFRNAWANPVCTPTRGTVLTGRYPFRTGLGSPGGGMNAPGLLLTEITLPEVMPGYSSAALGKWHVAGGQGDDHPNDSGFWRFAGGLGGAVMSYSAWNKTVDGATSAVTTYATSDTADEAILAAETLPQPFLLYVNFNAPHTPFHVPPAELCDQEPGEFCGCATLPGNPSNVEMGKAMVEAMDRELGRMLEEIELVAPDPLVIFMGDNGTGRGLTEAPFIDDHAKGSVYEGGVNVPLIISGPGVTQGECQALVSAADIHATCAEWAGATSQAEDSVSMVPYFSNPLQASIRTTVYAETYSPNGPGPWTDHDRAVRNERYKLIRRIGEPDELYDLDNDIWEQNDLFPTLVAGTEANDNYLALLQVMIDLGTD